VGASRKEKQMESAHPCYQGKCPMYRTAHRVDTWPSWDPVSYYRYLANATPHRTDSTGLRGTPRHKRNRRESYCCEGGPCIAKPISHCHRQTGVPQIPATIRRITFLSINTAALMVGRSVQILRGLFPSRPRQDTATESWKPL